MQVTPRTRAAMEAEEETTLAERPRVTPTSDPIWPRELSPGTMLGEYRIEGKIGEGGMGQVFAAVHPVIGKRAAIKVLSREHCADPNAVSRFVDEARVVNQIGHPNIVDVFGFGEMPDGRHYFAMELLDGETLGARMARRPLTLAETCAVIRSLARALDAAHASGIVHRDLKPDNVFLVAVRGEPPTVKLLDFGIAKLAYQDPAFERTAIGAMMGTPQYIAPEQARGLRVDGRADIYALGGILFELVTGRSVFVSDNTPEILMKHLIEPPPRPSRLARVPAELDELITAMLAKEPAARPSLDRVCEVVDRLRARPGKHLQVAPQRRGAGTSAAITAERPSVGRRWRGALLIAITLAAAGIAFAVVQVVTREPAVTTRPDPVQPASVTTLPAEPPAPPAVEVHPAEPAAPSAERAENKPRPPQSGRLELTVRGAIRYTVLVDGKPYGKRTSLALPAGGHEIEIRTDNEPPHRFAIEIEPGKTAQRDVVWTAPVPSPTPPPAATDDRALMAPGEAVPKGPR